MAERPIRLQLKGDRGFGLQRASLAINGLPAISCAYPSYWKNPWSIAGTRRWLRSVNVQETHTRSARARNCTEQHASWLVNGIPTGGHYSTERAERLRRLPELRGHNLACWCPLDRPCHCDVLLKLNEVRKLDKPDYFAMKPSDIPDDIWEGTRNWGGPHMSFAEQQARAVLAERRRCIEVVTDYRAFRGDTQGDIGVACLNILVAMEEPGE